MVEKTMKWSMNREKKEKELAEVENIEKEMLKAFNETATYAKTAEKLIIIAENIKELENEERYAPLEEQLDIMIKTAEECRNLLRGGSANNLEQLKENTYEIINEMKDRDEKELDYIFKNIEQMKEVYRKYTDEKLIGELENITSDSYLLNEKKLEASGYFIKHDAIWPVLIEKGLAYYEKNIDQEDEIDL